MKELPTIPASCALDEDGTRQQAARYDVIGDGAVLLEREPLRLSVLIRADVDPALVEEAIAVERECCSFFDIAWEPESRRLAFSVARDADDPALDAILYALGVAEKVSAA